MQHLRTESILILFFEGSCENVSSTPVPEVSEQDIFEPYPILLSFILSDFALQSNESCICGSKVYDMRGLKAPFSTLILDLGRCVKHRKTVQLLNYVLDRPKGRLESRSVAKTEADLRCATHC